MDCGCTRRLTLFNNGAQRAAAAQLDAIAQSQLFGPWPSWKEAWVWSEGPVVSLRVQAVLRAADAIKASARP